MYLFFLFYLYLFTFVKHLLSQLRRIKLIASARELRKLLSVVMNVVVVAKLGWFDTVKSLRAYERYTRVGAQATVSKELLIVEWHSR